MKHHHKRAHQSPPTLIIGSLSTAVHCAVLPSLSRFQLPSERVDCVFIILLLKKNFISYVCVLKYTYLLGASMRNPIRDKVMRQRSDGQGESNLRASPWYFLSMYPQKPKSAGLCILLFHSSDTLWKK